MRNPLFYLTTLLLFCSCAPSALPPTTIAKVQFVHDVALEQPLAVAVGEQGHIYAGLRDGSVTVVSSQGEALLTIAGRDASGSVRFKKPAGIAVADGRIFIADSGNDQVVIYSGAGEFMETFGNAGSGLKQFSAPQGITVLDGIIYVADSGNGRVQIFDESGVFIGVVDGITPDDDPNKDQARLLRPIDVDVDYRGRIFVVDSKDDAVKIYDQAGSFLGRLPGLSRPVGVAVTRDGIYVADADSYSLKKYSFDLSFMFNFGSRGKGRAQFASLEGVASDLQGRIYIADQRKKMVHVFDPERGEEFADWQKYPPRQSTRWRENINVAALKTSWDGKETLYAVDGRQILLIRADKVVKTITIKDLEPISVANGPLKGVWVVDKRQKRVVQLDSQGGGGLLLRQ